MKLYKVYSFDKKWWKEILTSKKIYFSTPDEARQKDDLEDLSYIFPQQGMYIQLKEFYDSAMKDVRIVCLTTVFNIDVYKNLVDWSEGQISPGIVYEFNFDKLNTGVSGREVNYLTPRYANFAQHFAANNTFMSLLGHENKKTNEEHFFDHVIWGKDSKYSIQSEFRFVHSDQTDIELMLFKLNSDYKVPIAELGLSLVKIHVVNNDSINLETTVPVEYLKY